MPYFAYAWIASIVSGFYVVVTKLTSKHAISNPWYFNFLLTIATIVATAPFALLYHARIPNDWQTIIMAALFGDLFNILFIISLSLIDVTSMSPLFNTRVIFTILLGALFLQERLSPYQWIIVIIMICMGPFATMDEKFHLKTFFKPAIAFGIFAMFALAIKSAFIKLALVHNDIWTTNIWILNLQLIMLLPTLPFFYKDLKKIKLNQVFPVGTLAFLAMITNITSSIANKVNIGITSLIMAIPFSMIIAFILSIYVPKLLEKHTLKVYAVRFFAAAVMILGALQLSR